MKRSFIFISLLMTLNCIIISPSSNYTLLKKLPQDHYARSLSKITGRLTIDKIKNKCTAFLLSSDLVITANHCVKNSREIGFYLDDEKFDQLKASDGIFVSNIPEFTSDDFDFSILRLQRRVEGIDNSFYRIDIIKMNEGIVLINYNNDQEKVVSDQTCKIVGFKKNDIILEHECFSIKGSSGAPIFSYRTGKLVGIHTSAGFLRSATATSLNYIVENSRRIVNNQSLKDILKNNCLNIQYKEKVDSEKCGLVFKKGRSSVCGVEKYRKDKTANCGIKNFNEGTDLICGETEYDKPGLDCDPGDRIIRIVEIPANCSIIQGNCTGFFAKCGKPNKCRNEKFGTIYNECIHENHGAETYKECEHDSFGTAYAKKCRDESFGFEKCLDK